MGYYTKYPTIDINHIIYGGVTGGKASGFHSIIGADEATKIIRPNENGDAFKVQVKGIEKDGYSSFFPDAWDKNRIISEIKFAYENASFLSNRNNRWEGSSSTGFTIQGDIVSKKIRTAYPVY